MRVPEGREVVIDVLANDTNSDGYALDLKMLTPPSDGTVAVIHDTIAYTAPADWAGTTSFEYRAVSRVDGAADTAVVTVAVLPVNHAPSFVAGRRSNRHGGRRAAVGCGLGDADLARSGRRVGPGARLPDGR